MPEIHKFRGTATLLVGRKEVLETENGFRTLLIATWTSKNKVHINFIHSTNHMFVKLASTRNGSCYLRQTSQVTQDLQLEPLYLEAEKNKDFTQF